MKTKELVDFHKGLEECFDLSGEEFNWKATLNHMALQDIRKQYEIKAAMIAAKYAKKDENGKIVMLGDNIMAIRDMAAYSAEMAKIDDAELCVTIQRVKRAELPKEMKFGQLTKIKLMIEELCDGVTQTEKQKRED